MASIIKNQLLKHLSRFTKNLSVDQINLSTLRGEGELLNLELDETVLTNLLELPSWLKLTNAWCNKVILRIQWTKLKSVPIFLHLDEVQIELVTCDDLRNLSSPTNANAPISGASKYSFLHKVIDGITVAVNTISITFKSPAFVSNIQISRIMVESKSPAWQRCDLRMTRVKDSDKGQLLIFKELEWQTVRIEARSTKDHDLTPLRLLTNQARCRITIKKRLSDCFVMGSRLVLILDDLLWVLTDSQLKAALHFIDSLANLIEKAATLERKIKSARKLEVLPEYQELLMQQSKSKPVHNSAISKIFTRYDVIETSYHFLAQRIDLHLCDDPGNGRSSHPELKNGGALQISLVKFQVDYYPYHLATANRKHWAKYRENTIPHVQWLQQSFYAFRRQFLELIEMGQKQSVRKNGNQDVGSEGDDTDTATRCQNSFADDDSRRLSNRTINSNYNVIKNHILEQLSKLMTVCIVIRIFDFTIYKVTTSTRTPTTKEFLTGDREKFSLPDDITILHAEFTYYYYPGDIIFPLPPPKFYVQLNPIQINYDMYSCLWFNSFLLHLYQSLMSNQNKIDTAMDVYFDVKLEAILPRIVIESQNEYPNQRDRPKSLHLQTSRVTLTNVRSIDDKSSRANLADCLNAFRMGQMFFSKDFPYNNNDLHVITDKFLCHCAGTDVRSSPIDFAVNTIDDVIGKLNKKLLWVESKDVWCLNLEPVWADFYGVRAVGVNRPVPLVDAFPLMIWLHIDESNTTEATDNHGVKTTQGNNTNDGNIHVLAHINNLISVQLNHYEYLFLLRQLDIITEMNTYLVLDTNRILKMSSNNSFVFGALIPQLEITFIMPSQNPGKENSGGDLESVIPDSSSAADEILATSLNQIAISNTSRVDFGLKRFNTSNDIETPLSEVSSMIGFTEAHPTVTFKQTDTRSMKAVSPNLMQQSSIVEDSESQKFYKYPKGPSSDQQTAFIQNNFNVGFSSVKKGFANLMTSIDSALKASPEDGSSDTVSIRSELSSDSENYIVVTLEEQEKSDSLFGNLNVSSITAVEEASEVIEETPDSQSEKSLDSACKRKDLVSMTTLKLSKIEMVHQSKGFASAIKLQVAKILSDDCTSIPWDELQTKFSSRSRGWIESQCDDCKTSIKLRLEHNLKPQYNNSLDNLNIDNNKLSCLFDEKLIGDISDINLTLSMSTVNGLVDLLEDEIIPDYLPVNLSLNNVSLRLNEDRPSNNITSPGPIPINLNIQEMKLTRDKSGVINIESLRNNTNNVTASASVEFEMKQLKQINKQFKRDNDELKRRLLALDYLSKENSRLIRNKDELELIKSQLNEAQDIIAALVKEKDMLQENNIVLQSQCNKKANESSTGRASWSIKR